MNVVGKMDFYVWGVNLDTSGSWKTKIKYEEMLELEGLNALQELIKEQAEDDSNDFIATTTVQYQPWMDRLVVQKF